MTRYDGGRFEAFRGKVAGGLSAARCSTALLPSASCDQPLRRIAQRFPASEVSARRRPAGATAAVTHPPGGVYSGEEAFDLDRMSSHAGTFFTLAGFSGSLGIDRSGSEPCAASLRHPIAAKTPDVSSCFSSGLAAGGTLTATTLRIAIQPPQTARFKYLALEVRR